VSNDYCPLLSASNDMMIGERTQMKGKMSWCMSSYPQLILHAMLVSLTGLKYSSLFLFVNTRNLPNGLVILKCLEEE
jgi:hypothetical protein